MKSTIFFANSITCLRGKFWTIITDAKGLTVVLIVQLLAMSKRK